MSDSKSTADTTVAAAASSTTTIDNSRGIPPAQFIEDVPGYINASKLDIETILKSLQTLYGKYKFMESQLINQQKNLLVKIPDINNALQAVKYLIKHQNETISTHFELADSIYANARISKKTSNGTVLLWLGANVMLEYSYNEAEALLTKNQSNAETNLKSLESDLAYLKDQITISEVNIARVHNEKVAIKQRIQAQAGISGDNKQQAITA